MELSQQHKGRGLLCLLEAQLLADILPPLDGEARFSEARGPRGKKDADRSLQLVIQRVLQGWRPYLHELFELVDFDQAA